MSAPKGIIVALYLFTPDDDLAHEFAAGLDSEGLDNNVRHARSIAELKALTHPDQQADAYLVLLDMRGPNVDARKFLTDAQRQGAAAPPVVVIIADRDDETAGLGDFKNMIAGRISSIKPAGEFVKLIDAALSGNWTMEQAPHRPD